MTPQDHTSAFCAQAGGAAGVAGGLPQAQPAPPHAPLAAATDAGLRAAPFRYGAGFETTGTDNGSSK